MCVLPHVCRGVMIVAHAFYPGPRFEEKHSIVVWRHLFDLFHDIKPRGKIVVEETTLVVVCPINASPPSMWGAL